jgi:hypothetical protein
LRTRISILGIVENARRKKLRISSFSGRPVIFLLKICFGKFQFPFNNISISLIFLFDPASSDGNTNAYYGTVEQQGRLTLHMHMLIWLKGVLSPQEIRDKIMDSTSDFQQKIVEYLESVHIGEFMTGTQEEIKHHIEIEKTQNPNYQDPTQTLPDPPPPLCENKACDEQNCDNCQELETWWQKFRKITDDLIFKSNVHTCRGQSNEKASKKDRPGCINKHGNCKARFPRNLFTQTEVDSKTGALNVKKEEPWINTLTPLVTYFLRCNSDVTSLLSGTAIKAIVAYISDYVTKPGLKTYSIFDAIRSVFNRSTEMLGGSLERKEKARRLITQTVNCLTAKMENGNWRTYGFTLFIRKSRSLYQS